MSAAYLKEIEERMKKTLTSLDTAFARIRTGRAHPSHAHAVAGVELLQLVAALGVVHAGVGQDAVHVHRDEADSAGALADIGAHVASLPGSGRPPPPGPLPRARERGSQRATERHRAR